MTARNVVLCGFMGTGKSTVGRLLAARLRRGFLDMDAALEERLGDTVERVFATQGEAAFRAAEAALCRELATPQGLVVACGGGVLEGEGNREALAAGGDLICLRAPVEAIVARVSAAGDRPLLAGDPAALRAKVADLLARRRARYEAIPLQLETAGRDPGDLVAELTATLAALDGDPGLARLEVHAPGGGYPILLGRGLVARAGGLLRAHGLRPGKAAVVTNPTVATHYLAPLVAGLQAGGFDPAVIELPDGEQHKTLATVQGVYSRLAAAGLDRKAPLIALGGGVVGDMTGFLAATYLRGVPFVQIPTSLLAMVDSSVGGKTGVDLPEGKNLVGAFKQPALVLIDPATLTTLPAVELRCGLAEALKHAVIADPGLLDALSAEPADWVPLLRRAVKVKLDVVEEDPFEAGRRAVLNLGHTFGHAFERESGFGLRHGEAVGVGLLAAARLAVDLGRCSPDLPDRLEARLRELALPTTLAGLDPTAVRAAMRQDKKRAGKTIRFVIPEALGRVTLVDDPGAPVDAALATVLR